MAISSKLESRGPGSLSGKTRGTNGPAQEVGGDWGEDMKGGD